MRRVVLAWVAAAVLAAPAPASAQMPDPRAMSGIPLAADDVPTGTVVVRVVRQQLGNYVTNQPVELRGGDRSATVSTDAEGRAQFTGFAPGARVRASVVVDGERLESQVFEVPSSGGVRVLLVAGGTSGAVPARPAAEPIAGSVTLGGETRFIVQFADDELEVFYLLEIVNGANAPVTAEPLVFDLPNGARNATLLEGSTPQATVDGPRLTVTGPFQPGRTALQLAFNLAVGGDRLVVSQRLPATLTALVLAVQKAGSVRLASTQVGDQQEFPSEGRTFLTANGPGIRAGDSLIFELSGLPHRATWPRNLALAIAALIIGAGIVLAVRSPERSGEMAARRRLEARRDEVLQQIVTLDDRLRLGKVDRGSHAAARADLVSELERLYGALDTAAQPAGDRGSAQ